MVVNKNVSNQNHPLSLLSGSSTINVDGCEMGDTIERKDEMRSRRNFLNLVKGVALGFGAACVVGVRNADAFNKMDPYVDLQSPVAGKSHTPQPAPSQAKQAELVTARQINVDSRDPMTHMAQVRRRRRWGWRRRWWPRRRRRRAIIVR